MSNGVAREPLAGAGAGYETAGNPASPEFSCMLFCGAPGNKDKESGGYFCELHVGVPISIRLEAKRSARAALKRAAAHD